MLMLVLSFFLFPLCSPLISLPLCHVYYLGKTWHISLGSQGERDKSEGGKGRARFFLFAFFPCVLASQFPTSRRGRTKEQTSILGSWFIFLSQLCHVFCSCQDVDWTHTWVGDCSILGNRIEHLHLLHESF